MQLSLETIRAVTRVLRESGLGEIVVEADGNERGAARLLIRRAAVAARVDHRSRRTTGTLQKGETTSESILESAPRAESEPVAPVAIAVTATAVGHFRACSPPVQSGDRVREDQIVGFVDSLKVPNEVHSTGEGSVAEVLVVDGQAVEYGQPLIIIEPVQPGDAS